MSGEVIFAKTLCNNCRYMEGMRRGPDDTPNRVRCGKKERWVKPQCRCKDYKEEDD